MNHVNRSATEHNNNVGISWKDLSIWAKKEIPQGVFRNKKVTRVRLLNSVSGYARSGSLTVIMGPSGAGKTTLLATLSGRASGFETEGQLLLNGKPANNKQRISISEFMPQHDLTVEGLTVLEHIQFMAHLKLDIRVSENSRNRIVEDTIVNMGLSDCRNTQLRFLSGGQRRRVSLGVHSLRDKQILFCDEPTTGLDSFNATGIVSLLKKSARMGKTVVCTIHQPGSGLFESFDETILMAAGGRVAFQGSSKDALDHFNSLGIVCPENFNTAEFLISQMSVREAVRTEADVRHVCERFRTSRTYEIFERNFCEVNAANRNTQIFGKVDEQFLVPDTWLGPGVITQFKLLFWRQGLNLVRNLNPLFLKLTDRFAVALIIGALAKEVLVQEHAMKDLEGLFAQILLEITNNKALQFLNMFHKDIPILLRETRDNVHSVGPYYVSSMIFLVIQCFLDILTYSIVLFWVSGFRARGIEFTLYFVPCFTNAVLSATVGCSFASIFETVETAVTVVNPLNMFATLFSGYFFNISTLPSYLQWLKYTSRYYFGLEAISILVWTSYTGISCTETPSDEYCPTTADEFLAQYGYQSSNLVLDFVGMFVMFVIFVTAGFFGLKHRTKQQAYY